MNNQTEGKRHRKRNKLYNSQEYEIPVAIKKTLPPTVDLDFEIESVITKMFGNSLINPVIDSQESKQKSPEEENESEILNKSGNSVKNEPDENNRNRKKDSKMFKLKKSKSNKKRPTDVNTTDDDPHQSSDGYVTDSHLFQPFRAPSDSHASKRKSPEEDNDSDILNKSGNSVKNEPDENNRNRKRDSKMFKLKKSKSNKKRHTDVNTTDDDPHQSSDGYVTDSHLFQPFRAPSDSHASKRKSPEEDNDSDILNKSGNSVKNEPDENNRNRKKDSKMFKLKKSESNKKRHTDVNTTDDDPHQSNDGYATDSHLFQPFRATSDSHASKRKSPEEDNDSDILNKSGNSVKNEPDENNRNRKKDSKMFKLKKSKSNKKRHTDVNTTDDDPHQSSDGYVTDSHLFQPFRAPSDSHASKRKSPEEDNDSDILNKSGNSVKNEPDENNRNRKKDSKMFKLKKSESNKKRHTDVNTTDDDPHQSSDGYVTDSHLFQPFRAPSDSHASKRKSPEEDNDSDILNKSGNSVKNEPDENSRNRKKDSKMFKLKKSESNKKRHTYVNTTDDDPHQSSDGYVTDSHLFQPFRAPSDSHASKRKSPEEDNDSDILNKSGNSVKNEPDENNRNRKKDSKMFKLKKSKSNKKRHTDVNTTDDDPHQSSDGYVTDSHLFQPFRAPSDSHASKRKLPEEDNDSDILNKSGNSVKNEPDENNRNRKKDSKMFKLKKSKSNKKRHTDVNTTDDDPHQSSDGYVTDSHLFQPFRAPSDSHASQQNSPEEDNVVESNDDITIDCPGKFSFWIDCSTWDIIKPLHSQKTKWPALKGQWTDVLAKEFKRFNPSCVLSFKYNRVKRDDSRKKSAPYFTGKALCKHAKEKDHYVFTIKRKPKDGRQNIRVRVAKKQKCIHKRTIIKKRNLTGTSRKEMGQKVEQQGASNVYYEIMADMEAEAVQHGNYTECLTKKILNQVLYEFRQKEKYAKEDIADVLLTKSVLAETDVDSKEIKGYIQSVGADPFTVVLFTEEQLYVMKKLKKRDSCVLHLDATGKIIRRIQNQKRPYYYAACVKNPKKGLPPIPVAELVSTDHTTVTISTFLLKLKHSTSVIFGKPVIPNRVECDFSWALINASLVAFCGQNIKQYLNMTWNLLHNKDKREKQEMCIIHLCCSHIIKRVSDKLASLTNDKNLCKFVKYTFGLLQNETTLSQAKVIYDNLRVALTSKHNTDDVRKSVIFLEKKIEHMPMECMDELEEEKDDQIIEFEDDQHITDKTIKKSSPYTKYFLSNATITTGNSHFEPNTYYLPPAIAFLDTYMPLIPLWGGLVISELEGITRDSNVEVENFFKIMKKDILLEKKRFAPGNFVRKIQKQMKGRVKEFHNTITPISRPSKSKTTKVKSDNIDLQEEMWSRKEHIDIRSYYVSPARAPKPKEATLPRPIKNNGLRNSKNNCWLNSTLQALKTCRSISSCAIDREDGVLTSAVLKKLGILNTLRSTSKVYSVNDILELFEQSEDLRFLSNGQQHDPSIFISSFLTSLAQFKPLVLRYDHMCTRCKKKRIGSEERCYLLSLEMVPAVLKPSTQHLLEEFFKTETLTGEDSVKCSYCFEKTPHDRHTNIARLPSTLIMQLKRFNNNLEKTSDNIRIDQEVILQETVYKLMAVQVEKVCIDGLV